KRSDRGGHPAAQSLIPRGALRWRMMRSVLKFPSWVPHEAQQQITAIRTMPLRPQLRCVVDRLATDLRMEIVWKDVARYGPGKEANVIECAFMRAEFALGYRRPWPRRTKDGYARVLADVDAARELGAQIYSLTDAASQASSLVEAMQGTENQARS